ncbi:MAG: hypothetical protein UW41_C0029G0012 [Candidatus Collierbacteria bacterium GW2011_GWC2_44_18]|uniref:Uncharacterized protein n=1 Tax=Candidatus Collierbacteria bacterium GW2011_GWC2_44_18 TaxID=1618392 RepID=A0A0G1HND2_9BACT|nr:MAG: hypothetical protein UW16_C0018G0013 [Microgenomates group bacterium GW2011_GWC1_44_10]KKT48445.1 MAG: hypothetical protein UW41_C0029G0012 [Candidatus Collierbacteria bacterium GW2011_GWC2_44_18]
MNSVSVRINRFFVQALDSPSETNLVITDMIGKKLVDEGHALLIFAIRPQLMAKIELEKASQVGNVQAVIKFELSHEGEFVWVSYCPMIVNQQSVVFRAAPTSLADLSEKRRIRDVVGLWSMKASFGIVDLVEFRQLGTKRKATAATKKLPFSEAGEVSWRVFGSFASSRLNEFGQFKGRVVDTGKTYNQDEI